MTRDSITIDRYYLAAATRIPVALLAAVEHRWIDAFGEATIGILIVQCNRMKLRNQHALARCTATVARLCNDINETTKEMLGLECRACDYGRHICPGCGDHVPHGVIACDTCDPKGRP